MMCERTGVCVKAVFVGCVRLRVRFLRGLGCVRVVVVLHMCEK